MLVYVQAYDGIIIRATVHTNMDMYSGLNLKTTMGKKDVLLTRDIVLPAYNAVCFYLTCITFMVTLMASSNTPIMIKKSPTGIKKKKGSTSIPSAVMRDFVASKLSVINFATIQTRPRQKDAMMARLNFFI
jgi:hypothetical protein